MDLRGKKIVFTGSMAGGTRAQVSERAKTFGCIIMSGASRMTDFLVYGSEPGQTLKKARDYYCKYVFAIFNVLQY